MSQDRRISQDTTHRPDSPPTARGFATRGRHLLTEHLGSIVHLHPAQLNVTRCLLLHTRQRRGDCTTFQGIIAYESGHHVATVRRTERDLERHGLLRIAYHHGLRRLWWSKLYLTLARGRGLPPRRRYRVFGALVLHIQAALKKPTPDHRRPPRTARGNRQPPTLASGFSADPAQTQDWPGIPLTPATEDRAPMRDNTSLLERRERELHGAAVEASLPDGREPRAPTPPAPAGRHGTATPPPARAFGPSDGQDQAALASGEAPATNPPASGGRGEERPAHADRSPDGNGPDPLRDLAARAALVRRFESADHAALRHDLHRLHNFMQPGPRPAALPLLILRAIAATLNCTDEDADFLARHYVERLRDERRRAPHGPPPVPRTILTDATGREWVLEWQQSTDPTP